MEDKDMMYYTRLSRKEQELFDRVTDIILERLEEESNRVAERIKARQVKPNINVRSKRQMQLERLGVLFRNGVIDETEYYEFVTRVKEKYPNE